jgi:DNA-binding NarL/FixJ family response regulator
MAYTPAQFAEVAAVLDRICLDLVSLARLENQASFRVLMNAAYQLARIRKLLVADQSASVDMAPLECEKLSQRQKDVLGMLIQGQTNAQIGNALGIAERTVEKHVEAILRKFGVSSRIEAAVHAVHRR